MTRCEPDANNIDADEHVARGAMLVLVAICLPLFIIMAAFAVDVAWMQLTRTELRTATDAASRAGAKTLSLAQSEAAARAAAKDAARRNRVAERAAGAAGPRHRSRAGHARRRATLAFTFRAWRLAAQRGARHRASERLALPAEPVALLLGRVMGVTQFQPQHVATSRSSTATFAWWSTDRAR